LEIKAGGPISAFVEAAGEATKTGSGSSKPVILSRHARYVAIDRYRYPIAAQRCHGAPPSFAKLQLYVERGCVDEDCIIGSKHEKMSTPERDVLRDEGCSVRAPDPGRETQRSASQIQVVHSIRRVWHTAAMANPQTTQSHFPIQESRNLLAARLLPRPPAQPLQGCVEGRSPRKSPAEPSGSLDTSSQPETKQPRSPASACFAKTGLQREIAPCSGRAAGRCAVGFVESGRGVFPTAAWFAMLVP
jgi:hypothetical protein